MKPILTILFLMLAGCCKSGMTNDQIIAETKKCNEAGMIAWQQWPEWYDSPRKIICIEKKP